MPQRFSAADLGPSVEELTAQIAQEEGVRPDLALRVLKQESGGRIGVTSSAGARGPMQLMPQTAAGLKVNPNDPTENIRGGIRYLKQRLATFGGDETKALAAYNAGPGAVQRFGGVPPFKETQNYVRSIQAPPQQSATPPVGGKGRFSVSDLDSVTPPPPPQALQAPPPSSQTRPPSSALAATSRTFYQTETPSLVKDLVSGFDPRTPLGRRNITGGLTAIAAVPAAAAVGVPAGVGLATAGLLGAMTGGAGQELWESLTGPPQPTSLAGRVGAAATEQGFNEMLGQVVMWPIQAIGRRLLAAPVKHNAGKALETLRTGTEQQLDQALTDAEHALTQKKTEVTTVRDITKARGQAGVYSAKEAADRGVQDAKTVAQTNEAEVRSRLSSRPPGITPTQTGQLTENVIQGPAKTVKDRVGKQVEDVAAAGPNLPTAPLVAHLDELSRRITPLAAHTQLRPEAAQMSEQALARLKPEDLATLQLPPEHPLPGLLAKTREALASTPEIPFEDAHKIKRLLDDAVNWDSPAKKQVQQITKGFRTGLRDLMAAHEPYNEATAAYERVANLHNRGIAPQLHKVARTNPGSLVKLIKGDEPIKLQMLKELLLTEAPQGGGAEAGQAAWNSVRAAWTHQRLIQGGPEKILDRIGKLDPDFVQHMYGDEEGQLVLQNLRNIGEVFQSVTKRGTESVAAARTTGREGVRGALSAAAGAATAVKRSTDTMLTAAQGTVTAAKEARVAAKAPTPLEEAFNASSLQKTQSPEQLTANILRAGALGPTSIWGGLSFARLVKGPKINDLIQWSIYSPKRTQLLVKAVTSPLPGMAVADLFRLSGIIDKDVLMPSHESTSGPPPRPTGIAP